MVRADCQHPDGPHHDCAYVDWRNSKMHAAEIAAREHSRRVGQPFGLGQLDGGAARVFHSMMNSLCGTPPWDCKAEGVKSKCCLPPVGSARRFYAPAPARGFAA
jgi:hypothetical protein